MVNKPDIVKKLIEEEKLGKLEGSSQGSHEELEFPEELPKNTTDESTEFFSENFENEELGIELTQHDSSSGDSSVDEKELLFQSTSNLMLYLDKHGRITKINKAGIAFSGFTEGEVIGKRFWKLPGVLSRRNVSKFLNVFKNAFKGRETQSFVGEINDKLGGKHIMDFSMYCIKEDRKVKYLLVIAKDITEQKETKETLHETGEIYRLITESTSDLITLVTFKLNPTYTYVNPSIEKVMGYKPEDLIGESVFGLVHPDDKKRLFPLLKKYVGMKTKKLLTGKDMNISKTIEYRSRDKSGNWHYLASTANIMGDELLFVSKDITERKQAEEMLYESEKNYKTIFENLPFVAFTLDRKGRLLEGNKHTEKILGLKVEDLKGESFSKFGLLGKKDLLKAFTEFRKNLRGEVTDKTVYTLKSKDREEMLLELMGIPLKDKDRVVGVLDVGENITERREAEEELKRKIDELETFHGFAVDREFKVLELKKEINELCEKYGEKPRYDTNL